MECSLLQGYVIANVESGLELSPQTFNLGANVESSEKLIFVGN